MSVYSCNWSFLEIFTCNNSLTVYFFSAKMSWSNVEYSNHGSGVACIIPRDDAHSFVYLHMLIGVG